MPASLTETVAADVRAELARANVSRPEAARRLGMSREALYRRLRGEVSFTVAELEVLAELVGVPVTSFMRQQAA